MKVTGLRGTSQVGGNLANLVHLWTFFVKRIKIGIGYLLLWSFLDTQCSTEEVGSFNLCWNQSLPGAPPSSLARLRSTCLHG